MYLSIAASSECRGQPTRRITHSLISSVLVLYDAVLTFPAEVRGIWQRKFSGATVVYILVRYFGIAVAVVVLEEDLRWDTSWDDRVGRLLRVPSP